MVGGHTRLKIWYNLCMIIRRYTAKQLKTIYYSLIKIKTKKNYAIIILATCDTYEFILLLFYSVVV